MAENSKIEWTETTWNPQWNNRAGLIEAVLLVPLKWKKPRTVFVNSMSDLFHESVPFEFVDKVFAVMALCPDHTFQILTKRPDRMAEYFSKQGLGLDVRIQNAAWSVAKRQLACAVPLPNVWLGTSCEDQKTADERIPHLLRCPAAVRFLSCEPLLGAIDLSSYLPIESALGGGWRGRSKFGEALPIHWVIVGGESGHGARPMHPDWARSLRDQCVAAGVPFLFKQWGAWLPWSQFSDTAPEDDLEGTRYLTQEWTDEGWKDVGRPIWSDWVDGVINEEQCTGRVGKHAAGRLLDGRTWDEYPEVARG